MRATAMTAMPVARHRRRKSEASIFSPCAQLLCFSASLFCTASADMMVSVNIRVSETSVLAILPKASESFII